MTFSRYYRHKLTAQQKAIYDDLVAGMENRVYEVKTNYVSNQDISIIAHAVNFDNPQLFYVDFTRLTVIHSMGTSRVLVSYLFDEYLQRKIEQKLKIVTSKILNSVAGKTMKTASLILHDWLVCNCQYGECNDAPNASHSIVGALIYSKCVCEGYAKAYKYLADLIKMRAIVVVGKGMHPDGTSGGHAWNIVMPHQQCFHVDVTFDLLFAGKYCSRAYYLLSTKEILYDHSIDPIFEMPECSTDSQVLQIVSGTTELINYLNAQYQSRVTHSEVRLTKGFPKQKLFTMIKEKMAAKDVGWYNQIDSFWYGDKSRTFFGCWK